MGAARNEDDPCRRLQIPDQKVREQEVAEMVDSKGLLETVLGVGRAGDHLDPGVAHERPQRRQLAGQDPGPQPPGEGPDRGQGGQIQHHSLDPPITELPVQLARGPLAFREIPASKNDPPSPTGGTYPPRTLETEPRIATRDNDRLLVSRCGHSPPPTFSLWLTLSTVTFWVDGVNLV